MSRLFKLSVNNFSSILNLNHMKKRQTSSKSLKNRCPSPLPKKATQKSKSLTKQPRKQSEYLILGDEIYIASTKTERHIYQEFQKQAKKRPSTLKKSSKKSSREVQPINLQQYVKTLSKAQKEQLFHDLQKEIQIEKEQAPSLMQNQAEQKLKKLNIKLENIRVQLMKRWEQQINKINHFFENQQISLEDKNEKIRLVQKIRNNKLAMIDHIRMLFNKIMLEESEPELNKPEQIQYIINSLGSLNSFESLCHYSETPNIQSASSPFQSEVPAIQKEMQKQTKLDSEEELEEYQSIKREYFHEESPNEVREPIQSAQIQPFSKESLKLDIRLDQVQFGKDHYDEDSYHKEIIQAEKDFHKEVYLNKLQNPKIWPEQVATNIKNTQAEKKRFEEEFLCKQDSYDLKLKIPLLMTRDRLEQIELEKASKEKQMLAHAIKTRMAYQVSQSIPPNKPHFTTLVDANNFVVSFCQFLNERYLKEVVQGLNTPYGKCSVDKLFQLRNQGLVSDVENNVLTQQMLDTFHQEIAQNVRELSQFEQYHNKAVFNAFNVMLNVYRPYYQLQGDVFPWNTSEKGLTFYQISDENLDQVFQKSKMNVLQCCMLLCGLLPEIDLTTAAVETRKQLDKRNEDCYDMVIKKEINQKFGDWYIKVLNFQALERLNLAKELFEDQIKLFCEELYLLRQQNQQL